MKFNKGQIIVIIIAVILLAEIIMLPGFIKKNILDDIIQEAAETILLSDTDVEAEDALPPEPAVITLTTPNSHKYISVGFTIQLDYSITQDIPVQFISSNPEIATVDQNGAVTGVSKGPVSIIAAAENSQPVSCELFVLDHELVFLSASRQYKNYYAAGDTNEGDQMHRVADYCSAMLQTAGLEVYICPDEPNLPKRGNIAAEMGAACYVAIHSNAGAQRVGTSAYYHNRIPESQALALAVFDTVAALTPTADAIGLVNGMAKDNGYGYKEIRFPGIAGVPSTLLEVEFHDKEDLAQWIIDNAEPLGYAIAEGIFKYLERPTAGPVA